MSFLKNKVNLSLDDIIKLDPSNKRGARQAGQGRGNRTFGRGFRKQIGTTPSRIGRGGRIMKRGVTSSFRMRPGANRRINATRNTLNPNTKKLVEELALKTVNRVLAGRVTNVAAARRGGRAIRVASTLGRQRLISRQNPVRVIEEVVEEESEGEYDEEEDEDAGTSALTTQQVRALPTRGIQQQVIVKRVPTRRAQMQMPIKKRIVVQRIVKRQAPARIQLPGGSFPRKGQFKSQQNRTINQSAPRGRAMDVKNNKMFSALFGGSKPKAERLTAGSSFLDRLPDIQRRGRGFSNKYNNDY